MSTHGEHVASGRTVIAVTGEDDRFHRLRSRAAALTAGGNGTVILYDLDAAGRFSSPVPTEWSAEGEQELMADEAPRERLDPDALETAGRHALAEQVRRLRGVGVDAWGWLPSSKDVEDLAAYADRQRADLVLIPPELEHVNGLERALGAKGAEEVEPDHEVRFVTVTARDTARDAGTPEGTPGMPEGTAGTQDGDAAGAARRSSPSATPRAGTR